MRDEELKMMAEKLRGLADDISRIQEPGFFSRLDPPARVNNWFVSPYATLHLKGNVVGHPGLENGPFESSQLYFINEDLKLARTLSRWFRLGVPLSNARSGR